ncbi:MAG: M23 family metallopeptidase [Clostridium sp.]|jgi:hypothetical protein|nr:M23 family metallopeptidase [Clostridium sp.]
MGKKLSNKIHFLACGKEWLNLAFGATSAPYSKTSPHKGVDIVRDDKPTESDRVLAAFAGTVKTAVGSKPNKGDMTLKGVAQYGNYVEIDCGNGYVTAYYHLATVCVKKGDKVKAGQTLGTMGTSGLSTGLHLHFGLSKGGKWVDPLPYLEGKSSVVPVVPAFKSYAAKVTAKAGLNVRKGAGTSYASFKTLKYGAKVTVLAEAVGPGSLKGWAKIAEGQYVSLDFLEKI